MFFIPLINVLQIETSNIKLLSELPKYSIKIMKKLRKELPTQKMPRKMNLFKDKCIAIR